MEGTPKKGLVTTGLALMHAKDRPAQASGDRQIGSVCRLVCVPQPRTLPPSHAGSPAAPSGPWHPRRPQRSPSVPSHPQPSPVIPSHPPCARSGASAGHFRPLPHSERVRRANAHSSAFMYIPCRRRSSSFSTDDVDLVRGVASPWPRARAQPPGTARARRPGSARASSTARQHRASSTARPRASSIGQQQHPGSCAPTGPCVSSSSDSASLPLPQPPGAQCTEDRYHSQMRHYWRGGA